MGEREYSNNINQGRSCFHYAPLIYLAFLTFHYSHKRWTPISSSPHTIHVRDELIAQALHQFHFPLYSKLQIDPIKIQTYLKNFHTHFPLLKPSHLLTILVLSLCFISNLEDQPRRASGHLSLGDSKPSLGFHCHFQSHPL